MYLDGVEVSERGDADERAAEGKELSDALEPAVRPNSAMSESDASPSMGKLGEEAERRGGGRSQVIGN